MQTTTEKRGKKALSLFSLSLLSSIKRRRLLEGKPPPSPNGAPGPLVPTRPSRNDELSFLCPEAAAAEGANDEEQAESVPPGECSNHRVEKSILRRSLITPAAPASRTMRSGKTRAPSLAPSHRIAAIEREDARKPQGMGIAGPKREGPRAAHTRGSFLEREREPAAAVGRRRRKNAPLVIRRLSAAIPRLLALLRCADEPLICCETARGESERAVAENTYLVCSLAERKKRKEKSEPLLLRGSPVEAKSPSFFFFSSSLPSFTTSFFEAFARSLFGFSRAGTASRSSLSLRTWPSSRCCA